MGTHTPEVSATPEQTFDIVVIGGGPGGYATALYGASAGLSIAVVEKDKVGGTCLHRGCIPAKEFLETAAVYRTVAGAKEFGVQADQPTIDFATSQSRKQKVVDQLYRGLAGLMKGRGITTVTGTGRLAGVSGDGAHRVLVDGDGPNELTGRHVVLAPGSVPRTIPGFEVDGRLVLTSDEFLDLDRLPASVAIIGGGVIGCEFASLLSDLGTQVTLLEALPDLLSGCDPEVAAVVARSFRKRGIAIHTGTAVTGHTPNGSGTTVHFGDGQSVTVDAVIVSVGRRPLTDGIVEPAAAVEVDQRGFVVIDEWQRTTAARVWAVGDVVDTPQLAHVGFAEGIVVVKSILGEAVVPVDNGNVPWCIYTHPEVAFAGLTEAAARDVGYDVVVKKDPFGGNSRARIIGDTEGLVKVVAERGADGRAGRLLGVHMAGPWVTELLGQAYLAVNWEATVDDVAQFIQPHPTLSETFGETVLALTGRGLHVG
jgi:dihydrolipoamide dehydrogenase